MDKEHVIPDVVKSKAQHILEAFYGNNKVNEGSILTPTQVKDPPTLKWPYEENQLYSLILTDPDAPSRKDPKFREWHHWTVVNIPKNDLNKGDCIVEYVGAGPPKGSGLHRYVFLVYKQPGKLDIIKLAKLTNRSGEGRAKFKAEKFAQEHNLGPLIACNFFQAEWDDYVPKLYKQLGE